MSFQLRPARNAQDVSTGDGSTLPAEVAPSPAPEPGPSHAAVGRLRPSLASILADEGVATRDQLEEALAEGLKTGERLGEVVLRRGWIDEARLAELIARRWDLTFVARSMITVDEHAQALLSHADAERLGACPVALDDGVPLVAIADPSEERFTSVREVLGTQSRFIVTTPSALTQLIADCPVDSATATIVAEPAPSVAPFAVAQPEVEAEAPEDAASYAPEPEHAPFAVAEPEPVPVAEPEEESSPALEELDRLLERLVADRVRASDQLAGYRRQLEQLNEEKAHVESDLQSLETRLDQEDQLLDSIRGRLSGLDDSLREH